MEQYATDVGTRTMLELVRAAAQAELQATGAERRIAFRNTRHLLAACVALGVPAHVLAEELGVRLDTVRARLTFAGPIGVADFAALSGVAPEVVRAWRLPLWEDQPDQHSATRLLSAYLHQMFAEWPSG